MRWTLWKPGSRHLVLLLLCPPTHATDPPTRSTHQIRLEPLEHEPEPESESDEPLSL